MDILSPSISVRVAQAPFPQRSLASLASLWICFGEKMVQVKGIGSQISPQQFLLFPETILCFCQMLGIQNKLPFVSAGSGLWWAWDGFLIFLPCTCLRTGGSIPLGSLQGSWREKADLLEMSALPPAEA